MNSWNAGDEVEIVGWVDRFEGVRFIAERVRRHPTEDGNWLIQVPDETLKKWKEDLDAPDEYFAEDEGRVEFWSGFLKNHGPVQLEND